MLGQRSRESGAILRSNIGILKGKKNGLSSRILRSGNRRVPTARTLRLKHGINLNLKRVQRTDVNTETTVSVQARDMSNPHEEEHIELAVFGEFAKVCSLRLMLDTAQKRSTT